MIDDEMSRPIASHLTQAHIRILQHLAQLAGASIPVSIIDLVESLGMAGATSLVPTIQIMERNGYVQMIGGGAHGRTRMVVLTQKGKYTVGLGGVRILGSVRAGVLTEAIPHDSEIVDLGTALPSHPGDFLLVVEGYSMTGDGILPGDKVLLRPNVQVKNGEIAAVLVGSDYLATLKRVYYGHQKDQVTLKASNSDFPDVSVNAAEMQIAGVFRGLIRDSQPLGQVAEKAIV